MDEEEWGGRVSRVLFLMVISLGPNWDRPRRRLRGGSRLPASASNLLAADSEIAAGRITLFTPVARDWSLLLSRGCPRADLDCRRPVARRASLAFTRHPCSVQLGLSSGVFTPATILAHPDPRLSTCGRGCRGGRVSRLQGGYIPCHPVTPKPSHPRLVPKGRFELPRGYPHYALNVARLPVPPLRQVDDVPAGCGTGADLRTRTGDLLFTKQLLYQLS